ncbi:MAG: ribbon-helix-helix protein, CopG family [Candidatus Bathyarchaeia archaeon]
MEKKDEKIDTRILLKKKLVCFRVDPELWEKLKNLGLQRRKTASELVREMIEEYVENEEKKIEDHSCMV